MPFKNYYETLGINSSATVDEIRRAYRILARRYHPDVNPGKASEDKFKGIAEAYETLSDLGKRNAYDLEFDNHQRSRLSHGGHGARSYKDSQIAAERAAAARAVANEAMRRAMGRRGASSGNTVSSNTSNSTTTKPQALKSVAASASSAVSSTIRGFLNRAFPNDGNTQSSSQPSTPAQKLSIIEISVSMRDALVGVRKTVEVSEPEGPRRISASAFTLKLMPPTVSRIKSGSIL